MKKILIILVAFVCFQLGNTQDCNWVVFKDMERSFRVEFPEKATIQSLPVQTAVGEVTMDLFSVNQGDDLSANNLVYMIGFTSYPDGSDYSDEGLQNSMLDGSVNGAVSNVNGTLKSSENMVFNGYNARDAFIAIQEGLYTIHIRNILVDNKLYFIQIIAESSKIGNDEEKRFFDSFELINIRN